VSQDTPGIPTKPPRSSVGPQQVEGQSGRVQQQVLILQNLPVAPNVLQNPPPLSQDAEQGEGQSSRVRQQVWILQAFCNKGTLMEAIQRGDLKDAQGTPNLLAILRTGELAITGGRLG
jgi:hypothetical protein